MSLTPLTPAQVGGSLGTDEIRALHVSGPNVGMVLVYKSNDPALQVAHEGGEVVVEGLPEFAPVLAPPVNTAPPTISGTPTEGQTLTVNHGTWTNSPTFTRQWLRAGVAIASATAPTYVTIQADVDALISCRVTGTNADGNAQATSAVVGPIIDSAIAAATPTLVKRK